MKKNNKTLPYISVIIPTYNREKWISEAIDSVLNQTYKDFEIIIVDDGSKDNTSDLLKKYGNKIKYFYQKNAGCSAARNKGVELAKGEWIAFLDSDDIWLPEKLAVQVADIKNNPDIIAHTVNATIFRDHIGKEVNLFEYIGFNKESLKENFKIDRPLLFQIKYGFGWPQSILTRADVLKQTSLFDTKLKLWQDMDLFYQVAAKGTWGVNTKVLIKILRRNEDANLNLSIQSQRDKILSYNEFIHLYSKLYKNENLYKIEQKTVKKMLSNSYSTLGLEYLLKNDKTNAKKNTLTGFIINPGIISLLKLIQTLLPLNISNSFLMIWRKIKYNY